MKITFLIADFNLPGGGERAISNLASALYRRYSYQTEILSIQDLAENLPFKPDPAVTVGSLKINLKGKGVLAKLVSRIVSVVAVHSELRGKKIDYLLGVGVYPSVLIATLPRRRSLVRIACEHNAWTAAPLIWQILRKATYCRLEGLVVLTKKDLELVGEQYRNIFSIPNARSFYPEYPTNVQKTRILSIGRLESKKGFNFLIDAFAQICWDRPEWDLKVVGDGPLRKDLEDQVESLGIGSRVCIVRTSADIQAEYQSASIFALASLSEGLPMVLLEAQACGLPTVAFDCATGPGEIIIDKKTGYLVRVRDIIGFSEKLALLMDDSSRRKEMGSEARLNSDRYSEERICTQWQSLLEDRVSFKIHQSVL